MKFERVVIVLKINFSPLATVQLIAMFRQISPIRSALSIQDVKILKYCTIRPNTTGGINTSAPIYLRKHNLFLE
jgi:hypothetical protein